MSKILVFGSTGQAGSRIVKEALDRGHEVTGFERGKSEEAKAYNVVNGDVLNFEGLSDLVKNFDVVISALGPAHGHEATLLSMTEKIVEAAKAAKVRLVVVGGAGSLEVAPNVMLMETEGFHPDWKPIAKAHFDVLTLLRNSNDLDWLSVSPAALFMPGEKVGSYKIGKDAFMTDEAGNSTISMEDYAVAVIDEVENKAFSKERISLIRG